MDSTVEDSIQELKTLSDKYNKLLAKLGRLISSLDEHTSAIQQHMQRVKKLLGISSPICSVCRANPLLRPLSPHILFKLRFQV